MKGFYGTAVGKAKQAAKGELEKLKLSELTVRQAALEVAKM
jgi:20S proteasome subunit alpha 7